MPSDDKFLAYKGIMEAAEVAEPNSPSLSLPVFDESSGVMYRMKANDAGGNGGFLVDYNDTATASSPINVAADTWTTITNNGAGAFTNLAFLPNDVTRLLDTTTGEIDPSDLNLGSSLLIRNDFTVTPQTNNSTLDFRYTLGTGGGAYTLELALGRLDRGAGVGYRFSMRVDKIYMGDTNTRDNPIGLQVKCSTGATLVNAGIAITVVNN